VAPRLLGKLLVRRTRAGILAGRIVELEAYLGPHHATPDRASHSHRGPTPRNQVMFGPPGHAYVYFIYGLYYCMNVTCEPIGRAGCILLRALEPVAGVAAMAKNRGLELAAERETALPPSRQKRREKEAPRAKEWEALASGPSRLCQALAITRERDNGVDLLDARSSLQVRDDGFRATRVRVTARIGIRHAAELPLRFCLEGHGCVSGPKRMQGRELVLS
jgi:DNA-3-methyladenine glycosylase